MYRKLTTGRGTVKLISGMYFVTRCISSALKSLPPNREFKLSTSVPFHANGVSILSSYTPFKIRGLSTFISFILLFKNKKIQDRHTISYIFDRYNILFSIYEVRNKYNIVIPLQCYVVYFFFSSLLLY